jgi:hypothetical protein
MRAVLRIRPGDRGAAVIPDVTGTRQPACRFRRRAGGQSFRPAYDAVEIAFRTERNAGTSEQQ